ncbi:MAG TPA: GTPase Era [Gemmatimonadales bacterium]|nr:GTPase Era [Gemmatimonadales bacterium]
MSSTPTRTGHIALAGAPNVGKSSLLNRLTDTHLSLVSPKPQATRLPVVGLLTTEDTQYVFHDLPGLLEPAYALQVRMLVAALDVLERVDVILHLHEAIHQPAPDFWGLTGRQKPLEVPVITVYTKADLIKGPLTRSGPVPPLMVSATTGAGVPQLLEAIRPLLPQGPFQFDPDEVGTQPLHFFVGEYLREAAFDLLQAEVPYGVAVEVEEFHENRSPVYIRVSLYVERDSQKGIVVGRGGRTLKAIGTHARLRLEALLGQPVYLESRVKVLRNWRRSSAALTRLGFPEKAPL